ncbi:alpha/beta fold hydrolase [Nocardia cerradoensis]|nr:alpha/beta hydrolase [Nocardia cerradoensis]
MGRGEPLLLIHGIGSSRHTWRTVMIDVAREREVIAVDLPGFGLSRPGSSTVSSCADALAGLIKELELTAPHVVGHSFGGAIALELGRRGVARTVVAFAPIGFWGAPGVVWAQMALRATYTMSRSLRWALPLLAKTRIGRTAAAGLFYGRPDAIPPSQIIEDAEIFSGATAFSDVCEGFGDYVFTVPDKLCDIPVTIVWGTRDRLLPAGSQARRARSALPNAQHVCLDGVGHAAVSEDATSSRLLVSDRWDRA